MSLELVSRTGALIERHPDLPSVISRLSETFIGELVTTDRITDYAGDPAHRVFIGDKLYGWAFPYRG